MELLYARDIYGKTLIELGKKDKRVVVLDADLSGSTRTAMFAKEFPERFFNFGVAEQNMMAASAGLASCGKIVFVSTFAMFATARPLDQLRNTVCYNNFNVKIVATHAGITVGEDGSSHQALEDIAILRSIPNIRIVVPADAPAYAPLSAMSVGSAPPGVAAFTKGKPINTNKAKTKNNFFICSPPSLFACNFASPFEDYFKALLLVYQQ